MKNFNKNIKTILAVSILVLGGMSASAQMDPMLSKGTIHQHYGINLNAHRAKSTSVSSLDLYANNYQVCSIVNAADESLKFNVSKINGTTPITALSLNPYTATFFGSIVMPFGNEIFLGRNSNGEIDYGWRMGVNNNPFSSMQYANQYTHYIAIPDGNSNFAVGQNGGSSLFEINAATDSAWFRGRADFQGGIQVGASNLGSGQSGPKLSFSTPNPLANVDDLYIQRINETNGGSNIFVNIGNDVIDVTNTGVRDTFTIGNNGTGAGSMLNKPYFTVNSAGYVGIGTVANASQELMVGGGIGATNYTVMTAPAADYVFENDYKLMSLTDTEVYIKENKHLPAFKSAKHYEANGYTMTEMNVALEQTVEELTLHAIAQEKKIVAQETEMAQLKSEMAAIKALLLKK